MSLRLLSIWLLLISEPCHGVQLSFVFALQRIYQNPFDGTSKAITELAGEFGSGKSQICHTLCVTAAKGTQGQINSIIFVDAENTFRPERVHQIAEARGLDSEQIMKKVFVCEIVLS